MTKKLNSNKRGNPSNVKLNTVDGHSQIEENCLRCTMCNAHARSDKICIEINKILMQKDSSGKY